MNELAQQIGLAIAMLAANVIDPGTAGVSPALHMAWNPGDYPQFLIVTSDTLTRPLPSWDWFAVTNGTNYTVLPDRPQQYFAVVGLDSFGNWSFCNSTNQ